jgi:thermostable 8-oxoguanine DNA glycosylase
MIDPRFITNYNLSDSQLEEMLIFCCCVAGKNAMTTAKLVDKFLTHIGGKDYPFKIIKKFIREEIVELLKNNSIGCHELKGTCLYELSRSGLNLRTCNLDDLVKIKGIGLKTANFFILHTRKNYRASCLDIHVLSYLKDSGYKVPKATPQSKKKYLEIQNIFLSICDVKNMNPAELDLKIWREYSKNN